MDSQLNTIHLSKKDNPEVAEAMASRSPGDTIELTSVTAVVREHGDDGITLDVVSAEVAPDVPDDFAPMPDAAEEASIADALY